MAVYLSRRVFDIIAKNIRMTAMSKTAKLELLRRLSNIFVTLSPSFDRKRFMELGTGEQYEEV